MNDRFVSVPVDVRQNAILPMIMNTRLRLILLGIALSWCSGCNHFADLQPVPDNGPPPASMQAMIQQYPQAQAVLVTTLTPNQLWQATFTQKSQRYQALLGPTRVLTADRFVEENLPDSLTRILRATVIADGQITNPRMRQWEYGRSLDTSKTEAYVYADYSWQQQAFTARWTIARPDLRVGRPYYNLTLIPTQRDEYDTYVLGDLPMALQTILQQQALTFTYAKIHVDSAGECRYELSVNRQGNHWWLMYDEAGKLLAITDSSIAQLLQRVDQLPAAVQQYLQWPELAGFTPASSFSRHTYGTMSTYGVLVRKDKQAWEFLFSDQGELIRRTFLTYGSF